MVARGEDAEAAGGRRGRRQPGAGHPAHARLHDRVARRRTGRTARVCSAGCVTRSGTSGSRRPLRVDDLVEEAQLLVGRQPALGHVVGDDELEAGGGDDLVDGHAGVHRRAGACGGRASRSRARQVGDDAADLVEARRLRAERGGAVVADAGHGVDLRRTRPGASGSAPSSDVGWLMVLPGAPRTPSSCAFGLRARRRWRRCSGCRSGRPGVAPIITWRWPDHTTSNIDRYGFQPSTTLRVAGDADRHRRWRRAARRRRSCTRSGSKVGPGQAAADHRDGADGVGEDLAVAAEALGHRDDADVGPRRRRRAVLAHGARRFAWYSASLEVEPRRLERGPGLGRLGRRRRTPSGTPRRGRSRARTTVKCAPPGASTTPSTIMPVDAQRVDRPLLRRSRSVSTIALARHEAALGGHAEAGRRSRGRGRGTGRCRAASARFRCTSAASRRSAGIGDELLAVVVGRAHRAQASGCRGAGRSRGRRGSAGTAPATPRPAGPSRNMPSSSSARPRSRRSGGRRGSAARAGSSRATRTRRRPCAPCRRRTAGRRRARRRRRW